MWERIRAAWQEWSILIVGLAVIFSAIVLGGRLSSSTNPAPAISSDQGRDRGKPIAASTVTTSPPPQGGSAKPPAKQVAQSSQAPSPQPAHQDNPATAPKPSANAAEPSPAAAPSPPPHDHMAASSTPSPSATTGQSPAPPSPILRRLPPTLLHRPPMQFRPWAMPRQAVWSSGNARPAIPASPARTCSARRWPA